MDVPARYRQGENRGILPDTLSLGAAHLKVSSLARSLAFYEDVIGLVTAGQEDGVARLSGEGGREVLVLHERPGATAVSRHSGLYHVALLYETRQQLAEVGQRIQGARVPIDGASDHGTHEAFYLPDPDGNGLELAWDRDPEVWPNLADFTAIAPRPLDIGGLFNLVSGRAPVPHAGSGLTVGHVHLHVADIGDALAFYRDVVGFDLIAEIDTAAFVSAGGYHHHLAFNTWQGRGAPPPPEDAVGLLYWTVELPSQSAVDALRGRAEAAGHGVEGVEGGIELVDPAGNRMRVVVPTRT